MTNLYIARLEAKDKWGDEYEVFKPIFAQREADARLLLGAWQSEIGCDFPDVDPEWFMDFHGDDAHVELFDHESGEFWDALKENIGEWAEQLTRWAQENPGDARQLIHTEDDYYIDIFDCEGMEDFMAFVEADELAEDLPTQCESRKSPSL